MGFRYALCDQAERRGVAGWVRNRTDGTVEALLQGSAEAVEALIAWARRGPPGSHVTGVVVIAKEEEAPVSGFELRPTL